LSFQKKIKRCKHCLKQRNLSPELKPRRRDDVVMAADQTKHLRRLSATAELLGKFFSLLGSAAMIVTPSKQAAGSVHFPLDIRS